MFFIDKFILPFYNNLKGVIDLNSYLLAAILSVAISLFNLYNYVQKRTATLLILFVIWFLVAMKNYKQYKAKKDENF